MAITVKNLHGTSQLSCRCGSWLKHWENYTGRSAAVCLAVGCHRQDLVGGHVKKVNSRDEDHYIVPICVGHNNEAGSYQVADNSLAPASVQKTCGR